MEYYVPLSTKKQMVLKTSWNNDSAHRKSFKDSIQISQTWHIRLICSETSEVIRHFKDLEDTSIKCSYKLKLLDYHFEREMRVDRNILLQTKEKQAT